MTKQEWTKLSDSQKLDKMDERLVRIEWLGRVKLAIIILGSLGLLAAIESKFKNAIKK